MVAAFCRVFARMNIKVSPFKAQNMALNSYVTNSGEEIGRSTAVQAMAAGLEPSVEMNPILMKPKNDTVSQLIVHGKPLWDVSARDYFDSGKKVSFIKRRAVREAWNNISAKYQLIVIEGAGSPAEINLRRQDIVNMATARLADAKVILVADIDKGGAFASLYGTFALLTPSERKRIGAFLLNKFRGDPSLLEPAMKKLSLKTGIPFMGVIPFIPDINIQEEDALPSTVAGSSSPEIRIGVVYPPHISNFTDLDSLSWEPGVQVCYIRYPHQMSELDALIIPGTKNTIGDLQRIRECGIADEILRLRQSGLPIIGLCGGYQMLGEYLADERCMEDDSGSTPGLGLLPVRTEFLQGKTLKKSWLTPCGKEPLLADGHIALFGYEIHSGKTTLQTGAEHAFKADGADDSTGEGCVSEDGLVFGTYLHGIFDHDEFRRNFINALRLRKGLDPTGGPLISAREVREFAFDKVADVVSANIDIDLLRRLAGLHEGEGPGAA